MSGMTNMNVSPIGDAAALQSKVNAMHEKHNAQTDFQRGREMDNQFPQPLFDVDPYSENLRIKQAILTEGDGRPQVTVSDKDVEYFKRLKAQQTRAKFQQFLANIFDYSDPANRDKFLRLFPEYTQIREKLISNRQHLEARIASLLLTGVQSKEDVELWFALNMGDVDMPTAPAFDPKGYYNNSGNYKAGPFAPKFQNKPARYLRMLNEQLGHTELTAFWNGTDNGAPLPESGLAGSGGMNNKASDSEIGLVKWAGFGR